MHGRFSASNIANNDTLIITHISYQTLKIPVKNLQGNDTVSLVLKVSPLDDVYVSAREKKIVALNRFKALESIYLNNKNHCCPVKK